MTLASNNELSETEIENRTCYYFDKITNIKDFVFHTAVDNVVMMYCCLLISTVFLF